jgi:hypothetical protein
MTKSKESKAMKILEAKMLMKDKKNEMKQERWKGICELEERKIALEEKKASAELLAKENRTMKMDPSLMDAFSREWWDLRKEIITRHRQAMAQAKFGEGATASGGATFSGGASEEGSAA